jgi:hypothetical protein
MTDRNYRVPAGFQTHYVHTVNEDSKGLKYY